MPVGMAVGVALGCVACGGVDDGLERPVARAYDQLLSWSDLRQVVPLEATVADSTAMADQYIEAWLKQQVVLHVAEQNLAAERLDMSVRRAQGGLGQVLARPEAAIDQAARRRRAEICSRLRVPFSRVQACPRPWQSMWHRS